MKIDNVIIESDDQKEYYISYISKIKKALKDYEESKCTKKDKRNYSRAYKFFTSISKS